MIRENINIGQPLSEELRKIFREYLPTSDMKRIAEDYETSWITLRAMKSKRHPTNVTVFTADFVEPMLKVALRNKHNWEIEMNEIIERRKREIKRIEEKINKSKKEKEFINDQISVWSQNKAV